MNYDQETMRRLMTIFDGAWAWLDQIYRGSEFGNYLNRAGLVDVRDGLFVVEVPGERVCALFNRRSEKFAIQRALDMFIPREWGWVVTVEFVAGQGRQAAPEPDYLELEEVG